MTPLELHKEFHVRPGTLDAYVVNEISSYKTLEISSGDIVLDVGANIGSFARYAAEKARKVLAYEPDPENFELLAINSPKSINVQSAIVGSALLEVPLYKNRGKNKGLHSTVKTGQRDIVMVPAVNWNWLLDHARPTKIKIDCEGAEYDFLKPWELPDCVKGLVIEYNLSRRGEQGKGQDCHRSFLAEGWRVLREPRFGTRAWATIASYTRA